MEVSEYYSMNDSDPEVLGYYKKFENGEEVIYKVKNNDQITGFYTVELNSEVVFGAMDNCGEINQIADKNTEVEDQLRNLNLSEHSTTPYVDQHEFEHKKIHKSRLRSTETEENPAGSTTNVQIISEDDFNKIGKNNGVKVKEGLRKPEPEIETNPEFSLNESYQMELSKTPERGIHNNQHESDSISSEIFSQSDDPDQSCEKIAFKKVLVQWLVKRYESEDTDENAISTEDGLKTKILEYLEDLGQLTYEGIYQMFAGEHYGAETNQVIQDIPQSSEYKDSNESTVTANEIGKYQTSTEENDDKVYGTTNEAGINESIVEMDISDILDDNEGTFSIDEKFSKVVGDNKVDDTTHEVEITQTSRLEMSRDGTETNENAAEGNLSVIIVNRKGKEKNYKILFQTPWEVAYLSMPNDVNDDARNPSLSKTDSTKINKEAVTKNVDTIKNVYVIQKDGKFLYKVRGREEDVAMCRMKTNEEDTLRESVHSGEMSISRILCVDLNKKNSKFKEFIVARKDGCEKIYKCKCGKLLPSNEAIGNLVDYFVEEQISNLCFDFHRAAKFKHFTAREDVPKEDEIYDGGQADKKKPKGGKKPTCSWHVTSSGKKCTQAIGTGFMKHFVRGTGQSAVSKRSKKNVNYKESGGQQTQERKPLEIILPLYEPTGKPTIKENYLLKQVLQDLENKEQLPKTKTHEEKGSKKKYTINGKPTHKSSLSENSKDQVENSKEESKKSLPKKNRKDQEKDEEKVIEYFEKYQCCLKEDDEKVKRKIEELQIEIDQALSTYRHLLKHKERIEKEETTSGCFLDNKGKTIEEQKNEESNPTSVERILKNEEIGANIEKVEEEQKNIESNKTDKDGISKNKEVDEIVDEIMRILKKKNIEKREKKMESKKRKKKRKSSEINEKKTMKGGNKVFQHKSKKIKNTTYSENNEPLPKTKIREKKGSTGQKLSKKKDTIKRKPNNTKIASSLSKNSKSHVENNKEESKKKMHGSNRGKASFSLPKGKRKVQEEQKNIESNKTNVEGIAKNKKNCKIMRIWKKENVEKRERKEESKKRKKVGNSSEINGKETMEGGNEVFQHKIKKIKEETTCLKRKKLLEQKLLEKLEKLKAIKKQIEELKMEEKDKHSIKRVRESKNIIDEQTKKKSRQTHVDYNEEKPIETTGSKKEITKYLQMLNQKRIRELNVTTDRRMKYRQKKEEEKSNILDGTEVVSLNNLQKRGYDSAFEDDSEEMESDVSDHSEYTPEEEKAASR